MMINRELPALDQSQAQLRGKAAMANYAWGLDDRQEDKDVFHQLQNIDETFSSEWLNNDNSSVATSSYLQHVLEDVKLLSSPMNMTQNLPHFNKNTMTTPVLSSESQEE